MICILHVYLHCNQTCASSYLIIYFYFELWNTFESCSICVLLHVCSTIFIGWRRTLTFDDIWAIRDEDRSSEIVPAFEHSWHRETAKVSVKESEKYVNCFLFYFSTCCLASALSTLLIMWNCFLVQCRIYECQLLSISGFSIIWNGMNLFLLCHGDTWFSNWLNTMDIWRHLFKVAFHC